MARHSPHQNRCFDTVLIAWPEPVATGTHFTGYRVYQELTSVGFLAPIRVSTQQVCGIFRRNGCLKFDFGAKSENDIVLWTGAGIRKILNDGLE